MSEHHFDIKFGTLGQVRYELFCKYTPIDYFRNISFISKVFIQIHDYSNKCVFIYAQNVRVLCRSITLISSFSTVWQFSTEI